MSASASSIRAGRAFVELFADNTKLVAGLRAAASKVKAFGREVRNAGMKTFALGAAGITAAAAAVKVFMDVGDSAAHVAARTGMTVEAFTKLGYAAKVCDIEQGALEKGLIKMQRTLYGAATGVKSAATAFKSLQLDPRKLLGMKPEQQFAAIAEGLSRVQNPAMRNALAFKIFGTGCKALLPLLEGGAAGLAEFAREAERLGLVVSTKDAEAGHKLSQIFTRMWLVIKRVAFEVGKILAPAFERMAMWVLNTAVVTAQWVRTHKPMVILALQFSVAIAAVGAALITIGTIIIGVGFALTALAGICSAVATAWGAIVAVVGFLISPIGLVILAVASLGAIILNITGWGGRMATALRGVFMRIATDVKATFGGIADAVMAGDIALAVKILWLAIKMEWIAGTNVLKSVWYAVSAWLQQGFAALWYGFAATSRVVWNFLADGWDSCVSWIQGIWDKLATGMIIGWETIRAAAGKAWNYIKGVFDQGFDVAGANMQIDEDKKFAIEQARSQDVSAKAMREKEKAAAAAARDAKLAGIGQESIGVGEAIDAERARKNAENDAEYSKARKEWQDAIKRAKDERAAAATTPGFKDAPLPKPGDIPLPQAEKNAVRGGFSAMGGAMLGFAVANVQSRIAEASEETAANTKDILTELQNSDGAEFSE